MICSSVHNNICQIKSAQMEISQVLPSLSAPDIVKEEADEAARGSNWRQRASRRQKENDAGNDISVNINNRLSGFLQSLKGHETNQEFESEIFPSMKPPVCAYWEAGYCARGEHCRFLHDPKV